MINAIFGRKQYPVGFQEWFGERTWGDIRGRGQTRTVGAGRGILKTFLRYVCIAKTLHEAFTKNRVGVESLTAVHRVPSAAAKVSDDA